jgi:branched-chain amino acid transport system permease protein
MAVIFFSLAVDGLSFGLILFLISAGLTMTLGVMRVANLAHCAFAMMGGYIGLAVVRLFGTGLITASIIAVVGMIAVGWSLERTLYRWAYGMDQLGQMLLTIGLSFTFVAAANMLFGPMSQTIPLPTILAGSWQLGTLSVSVYRVFLVGVSAGIAAAMWIVLDWTDFGARLRASVDNPRMARCVGVDVDRVMAIAFAAGCGLAATGGVLGTQMLALEPFYAFKYLVPVLIVVSVGGLGSLKGSFFAALCIGLFDTYGRYFVPTIGGFVIYLIASGILLLRPQGLFVRT